MLDQSLAISTELGMRPLMERVLSRRDILMRKSQESQVNLARQRKSWITSNNHEKGPSEKG